MEGGLILDRFFSDWIKVAGGVAFSVAATLLFLGVVGNLPSMEVPRQWFVAGAICAIMISTPVCVFMNMQSRRIAALHTKLREAHRQLEQTARIDKMTGLSNRENFLSTINVDVERGWLVVGDLDHFKQINDRHGHAIGDEVLAKVGAVIRTYVRDEDICARLGGEEFGTFLPKASKSTAEAIAERIRSAIACIAIQTRTGDLVRPTISMGVTWRDTSKLSDLLERADHAMYQAKNEGRIRIVFAEVRMVA